MILEYYNTVISKVSLEVYERVSADQFLDSAIIQMNMIPYDEMFLILKRIF